MSKKLVGVWIAAFVAVLVFFFLTYDGLPERVATHFDAMGNPNGFQSKEFHLKFFLLFLFGLNGMFGTFYLLAGRAKAQWINIPRKDYWFSSIELIAELVEKLKRVAAILGIFCNATCLFTVQIIYQQNSPAPVFRFPIGLGVVGILACTVFLVLFLVSLFKPPK